MPRTPRPGSARAPRRLLALALLCASPPQPDPDLDGRWLGTAGGEHDRVVFGVEIARLDDGATDLRLTLPVANFYGLPAWGDVRREGARLAIEALGLALELVDGRLVGSFPEPGSPVALDRVAELPVAPPWPHLPAGPEPHWRAQLGAPVFASPVVADGFIYVGTTGGLLLAVDAAEGRSVWVFSAGRPIHGSALVAGDALYFVCDNGYLYKLARADGAELWCYDLGDARVPRIPPHPQVFDWDWQAPTPALADGVVYVGSGDGSFHAVDAETGARRWRFETGGRVRSGAAIDGARVLVGSADHHVYALDRASGRELWRHDTGGEIDAVPVVAGERVLVAARGAGLRALATATGEPLWSHPFWTSWVESTAVVEEGIAYVGSSDLRRVTALDPAAGRVLWRTDVGGWSWGTPLLAGDRVYAAAAAGNPYFVEHRAGLVALDRATGRPLWRHPLSEPEGAFLWGVAGSPVRAGDRVIVATLQGALLAFPAEPDGAVSAPTPAELAGVWAGSRRFGPVARGPVVLERQGARWRAEIAGFRVEAAGEENGVAFELPAGEGSFRGRLERATGTIHGQWIQPGVTAALGQRFSTPVRLDPSGPGRWTGEIRPLADEVHFYVVIEPVEGGGARAFLRNPEVNFGRFFGPLEVRRDGDAVALRGTLAWQPESEPRELLSGVYRADRGVLSLFVEDLGGTYDLERLGDDAISGFHPRPPAAPVAPLAAPVAVADGWATASPEAVGLATAPLAALVEKLATTPIDAVDAPAIDALLVARHGKLVVEEYFHGQARERAHDVRSASKSLTATLAGAAIHAGAIELSTPVYATYDGGTARAGLDPRAARMTLEHLLAMDSGLPCDDWSSESPGGEDRVQSQTDEPDWHRLLLDLPMAREPGEHAAYCSVGMSVAAAVVARALGEPLTDAFDRLLGRPLEMSAYHTNLMPSGEAYAGGGLRLTARDFLKFGQLLLDDGIWNGRRILDPGWAAKVLERRHDLGSERLGTYTMGWWLLDYDVDGRRIAAFYAGGNGGNYIIGVPEFDLAIVFQASNYNQSVQHRTKLEDVPAFILRSALGGAAAHDE